MRKERMNGELRSLFIDSNFATKDSRNRYQYDLVGGITVPENSRAYVDNISFTNTRHFFTGGE